MTITDKQIIETILEIQSHSGLPIRTFYPAATILKFMQKFTTFKNKDLIQYTLDKIISDCMIEVHKGRYKSINLNIKSYDWC